MTEAFCQLSVYLTTNASFQFKVWGFCQLSVIFLAICQLSVTPSSPSTFDSIKPDLRLRLFLIKTAPGIMIQFKKNQLQRNYMQLSCTEPWLQHHT